MQEQCCFFSHIERILFHISKKIAGGLSEKVGVVKAQHGKFFGDSYTVFGAELVKHQSRIGVGGHDGSDGSFFDLLQEIFLHVGSGVCPEKVFIKNTRQAMKGHKIQIAVAAQAGDLLLEGGAGNKGDLPVSKRNEMGDAKLAAFVVVAGDGHTVDAGKDAVHENQRIFVQGHLQDCVAVKFKIHRKKKDATVTALQKVIQGIFLLAAVRTVGDGNEVGREAEGVHNAPDDIAGVIVIVAGNDHTHFAGKVWIFTSIRLKGELFPGRKMAP